jgi:glycosyltransferase involved in cell wall biosynthesis
MHLVVYSHKICWPSEASPSGYATDGGFPFQMHSLSELFEKTTLLVPAMNCGGVKGEIQLTGNNLSVVPLTVPSSSGLKRKLLLLFWLLRNFSELFRGLWKADAVHVPIPGDIGTIGAAMAFVLRKPLFVRYCQNWSMPKSIADRIWKWTLERIAGGRNIVLATGGDRQPPSLRNPNIDWIFATSLSEKELAILSEGRRSVPQHQVRLIIVCRQERGKGVEALIKSIPLIKKYVPLVYLDIVGDGSLLPEFKNIAASLNLSDAVTFHGRVDHHKVINLLRQSDLFCFPTRSEGFPKSVLEALACGLPVITTAVSVLPRLINGCGKIIDSVSPEAIARAVKSCASDPGRYSEMSNHAARTAKQYSLERWRDGIGDRLQSAWGSLKSDV